MRFIKSISHISLLKFTYLWLVISSFVLSLVYWKLSVTINIIALKDLVYFLYFLYAIFIIGQKGDVFILIIILPFIWLLFVFFMLSDAILFAKISSFRQLIAPFILIIIGYIGVVRNEYYSFYGFIKKVLWLLLFFGFIEVIFSIWSFISIREFFAYKNIFVDSSGYPFIFVEPLIGAKRMASLFLDPINLGHTLVCFFVMVATEKNNYKSKYKLILILIGLLLTFSKGAWLQLLLVYTLFNSKIHFAFKLLIIGVGVFAYSFLMTYHRGLAIHLFGFLSAFDSLSVLGHGLGKVGNMSYMAYDSVDLLSLGIADSFVGSLIGQLGILGSLIWFSPFLIIYIILGRDDMFSKVFFAQIIVSFLSENTINLLSILTICILIGASLRNSGRLDFIKSKFSYVLQRNHYC